MQRTKCALRHAVSQRRLDACLEPKENWNVWRSLYFATCFVNRFMSLLCLLSWAYRHCIVLPAQIWPSNTSLVLAFKDVAVVFAANIVYSLCINVVIGNYCGTLHYKEGWLYSFCFDKRHAANNECTFPPPYTTTFLTIFACHVICIFRCLSGRVYLECKRRKKKFGKKKIHLHNCLKNYWKCAFISELLRTPPWRCRAGQLMIDCLSPFFSAGVRYHSWVPRRAEPPEFTGAASRLWNKSPVCP